MNALASSDADASARTLVDGSIAACARQLLALHELGPMDVGTHASGYRTALTRLRATVLTFEPMLDRTWAADVVAAAERVLAVVQPIRDLTIVRARLDGRRMELDDADASALPALQRHLDAEAERVGRVLVSALVKDVAGQLRATLGPPNGPSATSSAAGGVGPFLALVRRPLEELTAISDDLAQPGLDGWLAWAALVTAQARAAVDAARPLSVHALGAIAGISELQDDVQTLRDSVEVERWLRSAGAGEGSVGITAGILIAWERHDRLGLRRQVADTWEAAAEDVGLLLAKVRRLERRAHGRVHGGAAPA